MKRFFKVVAFVLAGFILFVGVYLLLAFCLSRISVDKESGDNESVIVYVLSNGVHTDIVVPVRTSEIDWSKSVKFSNTLANDSLANLVAFGWGDKGFYLETPTWADLKFKTAFKAAFALGKSAIHATFYRKLYEGEKCKRIKISMQQYKSLVEYIKNSFLIDEKGCVINIKTKANYGEDDAFYEGVGSYSLFFTCNTWTNSALKACGQKACLWTPFESGIFYQYK